MTVFNNALPDTASLVEGVCAELLPSLGAATRTTGLLFEQECDGYNESPFHVVLERTTNTFPLYGPLLGC
jgi:hypothetical protein